MQQSQSEVAHVTDYLRKLNECIFALWGCGPLGVHLFGARVLLVGNNLEYDHTLALHFLVIVGKSI